MSKPNPNSNSIQLGFRLDFVFPLLQQQQQEQQEPSPKSNLTLIGFDIKATKSCDTVLLEEVCVQKGPKQCDMMNEQPLFPKED